LAQTITGVPRRSTAPAPCGGAHGLGGHHQEDRLGARGVGEICRQARCRRRSARRAETGFRAFGELRGIGGVMLPQRDLSPGARAGQRQRVPQAPAPMTAMWLNAMSVFVV
jgi:hypothetical protein